MEVVLKLKAQAGDIATAGGPVVVVNLYEGTKVPGGATKAVDRACGGIVSRFLALGEWKGKRCETAVLYPDSPGSGVPERILLLGLGKQADFDAEAGRKVAGAMASVLRKMKVKRAATVLHGGDSGMSPELLARAFAEGVLLGVYRYDNWFRDGRAEVLALQEIVVVENRAARVRSIQSGLAQGEIVAHATNASRELVNGPSNEITPTRIAEAARALGRAHGFKVTVMGRSECEQEGMGAFLGVARGSEEPCKFIVMEYPGRPARGTVCLVGKGITFDTGGISLKPAQDMDQMKSDMGGAAAVLGAMRFAADAKVPLRVIGIVAATENMPGGRAYKPGDILTSSAGVTIEVLNTDAEGRLILADALAYAGRYKPDAVIDLATLTGACVIALGHEAAGAMGNDEWLLDRVQEAATRSGERVWPLPLWSEHRETVKSQVADIRNSTGRSAGSSTAGAFLGAFTNGYRWVHLDIAGIAYVERQKGYYAAGGTGAGVRILAEFLRGWKRPSGRGPTPGPRTSLRDVSTNAAKGNGASARRRGAGRKASPPARKRKGR